MNNQLPLFDNPYRPGAGHTPPYLAGRKSEKDGFKRLLQQDVILENMVLTGLRGVGKTVLLDSFKPLAMGVKWLWAGTDLSEAVSLSEENVAIRILTDLSVVTSNIEISQEEVTKIGFAQDSIFVSHKLNYHTLSGIYRSLPGLVSDKLKNVLEIVWSVIKRAGKRGVVFAYDEAQILSDQAKKEQYPLSLLLDVFQSIQKKNIPFMLVLTGLPTLFPKLVEARTFSERMFHVVFLKRLEESESRDAVVVPIENHPLKLNDESVESIVSLSGGYPYFIQFICREVYDSFSQETGEGNDLSVPTEEIMQKLDTDFFAGRWERATDRQRDLLVVAASLEHCDEEFTVQDITGKSKKILDKSFSPSNASQMLSALCNAGLVYKNRHGRYSFAVPLLWQFIKRQSEERMI